MLGLKLQNVSKMPPGGFPTYSYKDMKNTLFISLLDGYYWISIGFISFICQFLPFYEYVRQFFNM